MSIQGPQYRALWMTGCDAHRCNAWNDWSWFNHSASSSHQFISAIWSLPHKIESLSTNMQPCDLHNTDQIPWTLCLIQYRQIQLDPSAFEMCNFRFHEMHPILKTIIRRNKSLKWLISTHYWLLVLSTLAPPPKSTSCRLQQNKVVRSHVLDWHPMKVKAQEILYSHIPLAKWKPRKMFYPCISLR